VKPIFTKKFLRLLWFAMMLLFFANWLSPVSNTLTRSFGLLLLVVVWFGLLALCWRNRVFRVVFLGLTSLCAIFLVSPARHHHDSASLRSAYVTGLQHYSGVTYHWGGESPKGIDCSGLIRRGLIDSLFIQGVCTLDAGLVRYAIWVWWHDCTAQDFGEANGLTTRLFSTPSINQLDHSTILPGDLAVTRSGVHIMAFVGDNRWIEADPSFGRVITVSAPSEKNPWFQEPMVIVRWKIFQQ
jgi:hypothetical protein